MAKPLDVSLLLAQTLTFVDEGERAWRTIRDRGEAIVVEPTDSDELQAKFAAARSALEIVEQLVAMREETMRSQWRVMVGGFGALASGLSAIAAGCPPGEARGGLFELADCVLDMGRAAALAAAGGAGITSKCGSAAMGVDGPPDPTPPPGPRRWVPEIVQGGAA